MPVLTIAADQVIELIRQLPKDARVDALRILLADPDWGSLLADGEDRLGEQLAKRGLDRSRMSPDEIERAIDEIAEGR